MMLVYGEICEPLLYALLRISAILGSIDSSTYLNALIIFASI